MMVSRDGVAGLRVMMGLRDGVACWLCVCFGADFWTWRIVVGSSWLGIVRIEAGSSRGGIRGGFS